VYKKGKAEGKKMTEEETRRFTVMEKDYNIENGNYQDNGEEEHKHGDVLVLLRGVRLKLAESRKWRAGVG
jgi:hypothetical protein